MTVRTPEESPTSLARKRRHDRIVEWLGIAMAVIIALGVGWWLVRGELQRGAERQHCITTGGEVLEVHGGAIGWVCFRPEPRQ